MWHICLGAKDSIETARINFQGDMFSFLGALHFSEALIARDFG